MKRFLVLITMLLAIAAPIYASNTVIAQFNPLEKSCETIEDGDPAKDICNASSSPTDPITGDAGIITRVANILSFVAAIIAVIVIIISGITMMTSGGDAAKVAKSRNTIIYTAIGLVVIVLARTIVVFFFNNIT